MTLDFSTLLLLAITTNIGLGLLCVAFSLLQPGVRGMRLWGAALLIFGAGHGLLCLHVSLQSVALAYAGWLGILVSALLMLRSLDRFCGVKEPGAIFHAAVIGVALALWLAADAAQWVWPDRAGMTTILVCAVTGRAAWNVWAHGRNNRFTVPALAVVVLLAGVIAISIVDLVVSSPVDGDVLSSAFGSPAVVAGRLVALVLLTFSVVWLEYSTLYATMEDAAMYDVVTGLGNRQAILAEIEGEYSRSARARSIFSIAIVEIDNFQYMKDTHGERAGDQMLRWVAGEIRKGVRPYDKVGRYGDANFLLMMPGTSEKESLAVTERVRQGIRKQACIVDGRQIGATLSIGIAVGERGADLDAVLFAAEQAIGLSRDQGRDNTVTAPLIGMDPQKQDAA